MCTNGQKFAELNQMCTLMTEFEDTDFSRVYNSSLGNSSRCPLLKYTLRKEHGFYEVWSDWYPKLMRFHHSISRTIKMET